MSQEVNQIRQGDLLFERLEAIDALYLREESFPIKNGKIVLAEGEKTGHVHTIPQSAVKDLFRSIDSTIIVVEEDTEVTHDEHPSVPLTEGNWLMRRQEQYVPQSKPIPVFD